VQTLDHDPDAACDETAGATDNVWHFVDTCGNFLNYISRESYTTRNVYWSRGSVCVCICLSLVTGPHYCTDRDVT